MIKSKKILSVVCALAMLLSMFSAFTVVNAAGVNVTAEVVTDGKNTGDTVEVKISYSGFDTASIGAAQFQIAMDEDIVDVSTVSFAKGDITSGVTAKYNTTEKAFRYAYLDTSGEEPITATSGVFGTLSFKLKADLTDALELVVSGMKIENTVDGVMTTYTSNDVASAENKIVATVVNATVNSGETPTPAPSTAPSEEPSDPTPTPLPAEDYAIELEVKKDATVAAGSKVTVTPKLVTGKTYTGTMDIVVQVYNGTANDEYAIGFVVFDDVAVDQAVTFYAPAKAKISVNAVDNINDTNANLLGTMVAKKVSK